MSESAQPGVVELVESLLRQAFDAGASDVHFEPTDEALRVRFRVDALLHDVESLPATIGPNVAARLKVLANLLTYRTDLPQEGGISASEAGLPGDIRVATFPTVRGERVVLRLMTLARRLLKLGELGHDPALIARLEQHLAHPQGLLLVCGPAGSGKTTTLFAMLEHILTQRPGTSILAVEDPVELRLDGVTQIQIEPARGLTYPVALRSLLRQDPQVLMIGEVRDVETAQIILQAALTGHLLLSTVHSGSAPETIVRLREMGLPAYQITSTLRGILTQRLVRTRCGLCGDGASGEKTSPDAADDDKPCARCLGTGFAGRCAIGQLVDMTPALRSAIMADADADGLAEAIGETRWLHADADRLIKARRTSEEEVRRVLGT